MLAMRCVPHREETPRPAPVQVPEGCLSNQSGEYLHADNPVYRYRGRDDGGTLVLVLEVGPSDGGTRPAPTGAPRAVLERTSHGFTGHTEGHAFATSGRDCPVSFPTEVVACRSDALTLRTAMGADLDPLCQAVVPSPKPGGAVLEHRLLRATPDAG